MAGYSRQTKHVLSIQVRELLVTCLGYNLLVNSGVGYNQWELETAEAAWWECGYQDKGCPGEQRTCRHHQRCRERGQNTLAHYLLLPSNLLPFGKPNWNPIGKGAKEMSSQDPAFYHTEQYRGRRGEWTQKK